MQQSGRCTHPLCKTVSFMGTPSLDPFATRWNKPLEIFVSSFPDHLALDIDALSIPWFNLYAYLFPPAALLPRIFSKTFKYYCLIIAHILLIKL